MVPSTCAPLINPEYPLRKDAAVSAFLPLGVAVNVPVTAVTLSLSAESPTSTFTLYLIFAALMLVSLTALKV